MSDSKILNNKIGARCLTTEEAMLILPTYEQIYDQLDNFRREKGQVSGADQKTNNIGIIGVRGAGKTSLLKTVRNRLIENGAGKESGGEKNRRSKSCGLENSTQDIILPIIVPENMSDSGTLMAAILGMLKGIVNDRVKKEQNQGKGDPYCIKENVLQKSYHDVLKQYTYIQKEYRDIIIGQYTTESDYVKSSAKVFNSDTEFIRQFHTLVEMLTGSEKENGGLLVLFIDDIDLSTWRCMDVVKTLLSYLANKNIVTFISGDLETFEEALTLEFLRQEKSLEGSLLDQNILAKGAGEKSLLESKRQLAYEYLKKILPPVYRHNIKEWSLEERGKYCIRNPEKAEEETNLSGLLKEALKGWVDPAFFQYAESGEENSAIPYTYHLFDNTSRGLNNVYNVLGEIAQSRKMERESDSKKDSEEEKRLEKEKQEKEKLEKKKHLLDTIVASKQIYNQHRNEIQTKMITVGTTAGSSKVYFDNAYVLIYGTVKETKKGGKGEDNTIERKRIPNPVERFTLFVLVDFAARILYETEYSRMVKEDESYQNMKKEALWDLFCYPDIAEKVMDMKKYENLWKDGLGKDIGKLAEINNSFLRKGELVIHLAYYKNLSMDKVLPLYHLNKPQNEQKNNEKNNKEDSKKNSATSVEAAQEILSAFWKALKSVAEVNIAGADKAEVNIKEIVWKKAGEYYYEFKEELDYFLSKMSRNKEQNVVLRMFDRDCQEACAKIGNVYYGEYARRILQNAVARLLKQEIENEKGKDWEEVDFEKAWRTDEKISRTDKDKFKRRIALLCAIHKENLWKEEMAETAISYLNKELQSHLGNIVQKYTAYTEKPYRDWIVDTREAEEDWKKFWKAYDGVSVTKALKAKTDILGVLDEEGNGVSFKEGISFLNCRKIIGILHELATNNRVTYGQYDAWVLERDLWEAHIMPAGGWEQEGKYSYFKFLLQCCYRYKMATEYAGEGTEYAELLHEIAEGISEAHRIAYQQVQSTFMERLNKGLDEKEEKPVDAEEFNQLFDN